MLFSSSDDNSVRIHDLMQKKAHCIATFSEHVSVPTQICATLDSSLIVSVGRDKVPMNTLAYALTYVHMELITRYSLVLSRLIVSYHLMHLRLRVIIGMLCSHMLHNNFTGIVQMQHYALYVSIPSSPPIM